MSTLQPLELSRTSTQLCVQKQRKQHKPTGTTWIKNMQQTQAHQNNHNIYYQTTAQKYRNMTSPTCINSPTQTKQNSTEQQSELSLIISQGLQKARKQVKQGKIFDILMQIHKKQLEIQVQLCKNMEIITIDQINLHRDRDIERNLDKLYQVVDGLKGQLAIVQTNQKLDLQYQNQYDESQYLSVRTGKIRIQPKSQQSPISPTYQHSTNHHKLLLPTDNISTTPSRNSSFYTTVLSKYENDYNINYSTQRKNLLLKRINLMRDEIQNMESNFLRKEDMILCQIDILKKEIGLVQGIGEKMEEDKEKLGCGRIDGKIQETTPSKIIRKMDDFSTDKKRHPRLKSCLGFNKITKKTSLSKYTKKSSRPAMFTDAKQQTTWPFLPRGTSQQKLRSHISGMHKNLDQSTSKLLRLKSGVKWSKQNREENGQVRQEQESKNEYYSRRESQGFPHKQTGHKVKNIYYYN